MVERKPLLTTEGLSGRTLPPAVMDSMGAFERKWNKLGPDVEAVPSEVLSPLVRMDWEKVRRGSRPLDSTATALAIASGVRGEPVLEAKRPNLLARVGKDFRALAGAIPRLPGIVLGEVERIPQLGALAGQAMAQPKGQRAQAVSDLPLVNLIPGTYVAGRAGTREGRAEISEHPLVSLLDILPVASRATRAATRGTQAAARLGKADTGLSMREAAREGYRAGERRLVDRVPAAHAFTPSQLLDRAGVGRTARDLGSKLGPAERRLAKDVEQARRFSQGIADRYEIPADRLRQVTRAWESGDPKLLGALTDGERAAALEYTTVTDRIARMGEATGDLFQWGGEWYRTADHGVAMRFMRGMSREWENSQRLFDQSARTRARADTVAPTAAPPLLRRAIELHEKAQVAAEKVVRRQARLERYFTGKPSARFMPAMGERLREEMTTIARQTNPDLTGPAWEKVLNYTQNGMFELIPGMTSKQIRRTAREVAKTWGDLKAQGVDPVFVHHVGEGARHALLYPKIVPDRPVTPAQLRRRGIDMRPSDSDLVVGLTAQQAEYLRRAHTQATVSDIVATWGKDPLTVRTQMAELAAKGMGRGETLAAKVDNLMNDAYVRFDPGALFPYHRAAGAHTEAVLIPKTLEGTLKLMQKPPGVVAKAVDKALMNPFRTSVLALSPRFHLNNIISGALMLQARTGPDVWKFLGPARQMVKEGRVPDELARGIGSVPREMRAWQHASGRTLGRILKEANPGGFRDRFGRTVEASFKFGELIDDMYRSMGYLYGENKAARLGLGAQPAKMAGLELSNRILQNWDRMTPIERSVIRYVFPFYGWCVDRETEALTKRGWVSGDDITEQDEILSMDPATNQLRWSAVKSIYRGQYTGPMHHLTGHSVDALVTPNHSWALNDGRLLPVEQLRCRHTLQTMGSRVEDGGHIYTDAFVEVVGWAVTEGHYKRNAAGNRTTIEISQKDGRDTCDLIRGALKRAGARWHEYLAGVDRKIRYFGMTGPLVTQVRAVAPNRVMTPEFLCALTPDQRTLLIETMLLGDGTRPSARNRHDPWVLATAQEDAADAFVMLCTLAGIPTYKRKDNNSWHVTCRTRTTQQVRNLAHEPSRAPVPIRFPQVPYDGQVWCPETEYGTFVARRRGKVYVTGNTRHIIPYTFTLPFDHPLRVSIVNSFAEAEREDADSGLPDQFHSLFTLGQPNEYGDVKTVNPGGMNPFMDSANYFTLAGFIGQLNPGLSAGLSVMGVDERSGSAELHPTLVYDPVTGKLVAARRGAVGVLAPAIIPQVGGVADLVSQSQELRELKATRPDLFKARIVGAFGLPSGLIPRRTNEAEARARAELARYTALKQAGGRVARGDYDAAKGYTSLERIADALKAQAQAAGQAGR